MNRCRILLPCLLLAGCAAGPRAALEPAATPGSGVVSFSVASDYAGVYQAIGAQAAACFEKVAVGADPAAEPPVRVHRELDASSGRGTIVLSHFGALGPPLLEITIGRIDERSTEVRERYQDSQWRDFAGQVERWIKQASTSCRPSEWVPVQT